MSGVGQVTVTETPGQPIVSTDPDWSMVVIGATSTTPIAAGQVSAPYSSLAQLVADFGLGDAVDAACQAIAVTPDNPAPTPVSIYRTPATTPGTRGTIDHTGVTGTAVPTATASTHPLGTYEPVGRVIVGGTAGTGPITFQFSLNGGRNWLPQVTITTALTIKIQILVNGVLVDTGVQYDFLTSSTWVAGDTWTETKTTPPIWGDSDLYSAGPPATGALAAIASTSQMFGIAVITEPIQSSDFSTLTAGLNNFAAQGKKAPLLIVRFRDPTSGETDAAYVAAFQAFVNANHDNRIYVDAGNGWLTDAFRGFVYLRSRLPALLARLQGRIAIPGPRGERLAQSPGWVGRGPLPGFTLVDAQGNLVGHDEATLSGIVEPTAKSTGGGGTSYFLRVAEVKGTYSTKCPVMYPANSTILRIEDRLLANGMERVATGLSYQEIQGADIWDPVTFALDSGIRTALAGKIGAAIRLQYAREFQNAADPNLVTIDETAAVSGDDVTITGTLSVRFYGYRQNVKLAFSASR